MYSINLSYTAVRKYLEYLMSTNMLKGYSGVKAYKATGKGMVFLEKWRVERLHRVVAKFWHPFACGTTATCSMSVGCAGKSLDNFFETF